ncbi:MAG: hypothetical protein FWF37_01565 [Chloroflexi bacterium]|nr:hypothetical protein [Chloroflexota bacterium]
MDEITFEYASIVRYLKPEHKDKTPINYADVQMQTALSTEFGKQTGALSSLCKELEGGGWYLNSHNITVLPDSVLMISYVLQRPKRKNQ